MSASAAQFQFAAEFITFLAATAGLGLALLRGELLTRSLPGRLALVGGFSLIATTGFLSGSLLVDDSRPLLMTARAVGIVVVAAGTLSWSGGQGARRMLWAGLALMAASQAVAITAPDVDANSARFTIDLLLGAGAAAVVVAVLTASRRSIAARVAASAAGTLLLVVLVLSVALSSVLSSTVEDEAIRRLDARASTEASLLRSRADEILGRADLTARSLAAGDSEELLRLFERFEPSPVIDSRLSELSNLFPTSVVELAYLAPTRIVLGRAGLEPEEARQLADTAVVRDAIVARGSRSSVAVVGPTAALVAASPVIGPPPTSPLIGLVVASTTLDAEFLSGRAADDQTLSLALVGADSTLSAIGRQPADNDLRPLVDRVLTEGTPVTLILPDRFVAVRPVPAADGRPIAALVASTPTTLVAQTRESLFRTLFLIALGGTLLALLLASLVGERIGGGLRRLTVASEAIQSGDLTVRSGVATDDEVGALGQAFDSMASSIEEQTVALQEAADDETRLRNRLEAVVAGMGEALVAVDADGRVTDFNRAAEELVGLTAGEARGRYADRVVTLVADDGGDLAARLRKPSPARWSAMATVTRGKGTGVPVAVSAGALRGPGGELAGNVFVFRDLRREREVERMKTEFLSRVGHELRTPLTGIVGFAEILARRDVPPESAKQWHMEILDSSKKLQRIVEMLEFFASTGAGRMLLRREQLHVRTIIDDELGWWEERLDPPHSIGKRLGRSLPMIFADRRWLKQSVHELIDNAVKFSPNGGKILITARSAPREGVKGVEISVVDKGKGMSAEEQAQAFGEFVQGDSSDTRTFGGLGLGLTLVQRVAETHGGAVSVDSRTGKGTSVTIWLPVEA